MLVQQALILPASLADERLHGLHIAPFQGQGHGLDRLLLHTGPQQALQVLVAPVGLCGTIVEIRKGLVVRYQFIRQGLGLLRRQLKRGRRQEHRF